ncbi:MAG: SCO family protein [Gammaproteobacteria bacterium]|nr:SCO family protein [Gammaproteobacteria bacterium]
MIRIFSTLLLIAAATTAGYWLSQWYFQSGQSTPESLEASVLPQARSIADFNLTTHNQGSFNKASLQGKWTFLFFGYTQCPDVCPTTLAIMNNVARELERKSGHLNDVQFVFVSVDPERDTPEQLKQYVTYFHPQFIGATGQREQINHLTSQMSVMYFINKRAGGKQDQYTVDHSSAILLTEPSGNLRALFSTPHVPDKILEDFNKIREHYS